MIVEWWIWKNLEGDGCGLIQVDVTVCHLPGYTKWSQETVRKCGVPVVIWIRNYLTKKKTAVASFKVKRSRHLMNIRLGLADYISSKVYVRRLKNAARGPYAARQFILKCIQNGLILPLRTWPSRAANSLLMSSRCLLFLDDESQHMSESLKPGTFNYEGFSLVLASMRYS